MFAVKATVFPGEKLCRDLYLSLASVPKDDVEERLNPEEIPQSPAFRRFARGKSGDQAKLIKEFLLVAVNRFRSDQIDKLRKTSLKAAIKEHGIASKTTLASISQQNKARILSGVSVPDTPEMIEAKQVVQNLVPLFTHNTNSLRSVPEGLLLSSRSRERLGLSGGVNQNSFNKEFLKTDDQVYFFVDFSSRDGVPKFQSNKGYGEESLALEKNFATQHAWVSAFVMHPPELIALMKDVTPAEYEKVSEIIRSDCEKRNRENPYFSDRVNQANSVFSLSDPAEKLLRYYYPYEIEELIKPNLSLLKAGKEMLHRWDFTPDDFIEIVRTQLLASLNSLRLKDPTEFEKTLQVLRTGNNRAIEPILKKLVFEPLGMPHKFELKVPVAVESVHVQRIDSLKGQ